MQLITTLAFPRFRLLSRIGPTIALSLAVVIALGACSSPTPASEPAEDETSVVQPGGPTEAADAPTEEGLDDEAETLEPTPTATSAAVTLIIGRVTDTAGEPITDVSVTIVESTVPVPQMAIFTDAAGTYTWYVQPGAYTIQAYRDGYESSTGEIVVEEGSSAELNFELESR